MNENMYIPAIIDKTAELSIMGIHPSNQMQIIWAAWAKVTLIMARMVQSYTAFME